jgi:hypothetical protein
VKTVSYRAGSVAALAGETRAMESSITQRMGQIRGKATDAERAELVMQIANDIRTLPAGQGKLGAIRSLANLSTEGALGTEALTAVATTLAEAIKDSFPCDDRGQTARALRRCLDRTREAGTLRARRATASSDSALGNGRELCWNSASVCSRRMVSR